MDPVIQVKGLRKSYGATSAVDGVSLEVRAAEIFGLVGPNGAGKTTTLECIEGLRTFDAGVIRVLGLDPVTDGPVLKRRIGIQLQDSEVHERLKVWEALDLFACFYPNTVDPAALLTQLGLQDKRSSFFGTLSGGQRQRLFIALALVHDPEVLFLDELTSGLDPQARRGTWQIVRDLRERGKTVVLSSHSMEEAEQLCDRLAIMDHGRVLALDTPAAIIASTRSATLEDAYLQLTGSPHGYLGEAVVT